MLRLIPAIFGLLVFAYAAKSYMSVAGAIGVPGANPAAGFGFGSFGLPFGGGGAGADKDDGKDPEAPEVMKNIDAFRSLASFARGVVSPTAKPGYAGQSAPARGPALIWDVATDLPSKAHFYLSAETRAADPSGPVTVFLVMKQERAFHTEYGQGTPMGVSGGKTGVKGFRTDSTIAVVALPERAVLGTFTVTGKAPPFQIWVPTGQTEVDGDWWKAVKDWVEPGVRGPAWQAKKKVEDFRKNTPPTPKGLEHLLPLADAAKAALPKAKVLANAPKPKTDGKVLVWEYNGNYFHDKLGEAFQHLPDDRKAAAGDEAVTVFFLTNTDFKSWPDGKDKKASLNRNEYTVSVVTLPGPKPVGTYRIQGAAVENRNDGRYKGPPDPGTELAKWIAAFGAK